MQNRQNRHSHQNFTDSMLVGLEFTKIDFVYVPRESKCTKLICFFLGSILPIHCSSWLSEGLLMVQNYALHNSKIIAIALMLGPLGYMGPWPKNWQVPPPRGIFSTSQRISSLTGPKAKWNLFFFFNFTVRQIHLSLPIDVDCGYETGCSKAVTLNRHPSKYSNISCNCRRKREKGWMA